MDEGKAEGLVHWINALDIGIEPITTLRELHDGRALLKLQYAVQNIDQDDAQLPQDRFTIIQEYLEVMYQINFPRLIDVYKIIHAQDEKEIAKVALLLLCVAAVFRSHNIDNFIQPLFSLEQCIQEEVKELIESVLIAHEPSRPLHVDFSVLNKKKTQEATIQVPFVESFANHKCEVFSNSPQPTGRGSTGSLKEFMSPLLAGSASNSPIPFQSLSLSSPHVVKRLMAKEKETKRRAECLVRQKDVEMRRLTLDLHSEKNLREDLEMDIEEKSKLIQTRDVRIKELENQNVVVRQLKQEIEFLNDEKSQFENQLQRLRKSLDDQRTLREKNLTLEEENAQLSIESKQQINELRELSVAREEFVILRDQAITYQNKISQMEEALKLQEDQLSSVSEAKVCTDLQLSELQKMYRTQKEFYEEFLHTEKNNVAGESLGFITQKRVGELEAELEQLKAEHQRLRVILEEKDEESTKHQQQIQEQAGLHRQVLEREIEAVKRFRLAEEQHKIILKELEEKNFDTEKLLKENYTTLISNLKQEQEYLKDSHKNAINTLTKEYNETMEAMSNANSDLQNQFSSKQAEFEQLMSELLLEKSEKLLSEEKLQSECDKLQNSQRELITLQETLQALESKFSDLKTKHQEEVKKITENLSEERISFEEQLKHITLSKDQTFLEHKTLADSQMLELKQALETKNIEAVDLNQTCSKLKEDLLNQQKEIESAKSSLENERLELIQKVSSLSEEKASIRNQMMSELLQEKSEKLSSEEKLQSECEKLQNSQRELITLQETLQALDSKFSDLKTKHQEEVKQTTEKLSEERISFKEQLKHITLSKDQTFLEHKTLADSQMLELKQALETKNIEAVDLNQTCSKLKDEILHQQKEIESAKSSLENETLELIQKVSSLGEEKTSIQNQMCGLQEQMEKLTENLESLKTDNLSITEELQNTIVERDAAIVKRDKAAKLNEELTDISEKQVLQYEEELAFIKGKHASELQDKAEEHALLVQEISQQHAELQITQASEQKATVKQLGEQIFTLQQELEDKDSFLLQRDMEVSTLSEKKDAEISELTSKLTDVYQSTEDKIRVVTEEFKTQVLGYQQQLSALEREKEETTESLKQDEEKKMSEITSDFENQKAKYEKLLAESAELHSSECSSLKSSVEGKLSEAYQKCRIEIEEMKTAHVAEVEQLRMKLEEQKTSFDSQIDEFMNEAKRDKQCLLQSHNEEILQLRDRHEDNLAMMKSEFEDRLGQLGVEESSLREQLNQLTESHRNQLTLQEQEHHSQRVSREKHFSAELTAKELEIKSRVTAQDQEYQSVLVSKEGEYMDKLASKEQEFETQLSSKEQEYHNSLSARNNEYLSKIASKEDEFKAEFLVTVEKLNKEIAAKDTEHQIKLTSNEEEWKSKLLSVEEEYKSGLASTEVEFKAQLAVQEEELCQLRNSHSVLVKELTDLKKEIDRLTTELSDYKLKEFQHDSSHNKCVQQMDLDFKRKENYLQEEIYEKSEVIEGLTASRDSLQAQLNEHTKMVETLNVQAQDQQSHHNQSISQLQEKLKTIEVERQAIEGDYETQLGKLKIEMEAVYNNNTELQDIHDSITEELREKNQEVLATKKLVEEKEASLVDLQNKITEQKNKYSKKMEQMTASMETKINGFMAKYEERKQQEHDAYVSEFKSKLCLMEEEQKQELSQVSEEYEDRLRVRAVELDTQQSLYESKLKAVCEERDKMGEELAQTNRVYEERMEFLTNEVEKLTLLQESLKRNILQQTAKLTASEEKAAHCAELEALIEQLEESREKERREATDQLALIQSQLEASQLHLKRENESFTHQVTELESRTKENSKHYENKIVELKQTQAAHDSQFSEQINHLQEKGCQLEEQLYHSEAQNGKLQVMVDNLKGHLENRKSRLQIAVHELEMERLNVEKYTEKFELLDSQFMPLQKKLQEEEANNKRLSQQVRSLEVQLSHAEIQVKQYRTELDKAGTALLGDIHPNFHAQTKPSSSSDDSILDDSLEANDKRHSSPHPNRPKPAAPYFLRSRHSSTGDMSHTSGEMSPHMSLNVDKSGPFQAITLTSCALTPQGKTNSTIKQSESGRPISIKSKLKGTSQSLRSLASLNSSLMSTFSTDSTKSANIPRGAGSLFSCEDEEDTGVDYQWNRLDELKRRNTFCLPHLKTAYPVETQVRDPKGLYNENIIRGQLSDTSTSQLNTRKRRPEVLLEDRSEISVPSTRKSVSQARHSTMDQPKPVQTRQRHLSAEKLTPRKSPRRSTRRRSKSAGTPDTLRNVHDIENISSFAVDPRRESIAFSISNTPKDLRRGLKRQTGFVRKNEETSKSSQIERKPLGNRNVLQTGV